MVGFCKIEENTRKMRKQKEEREANRRISVNSESYITYVLKRSGWVQVLI
jgi:hypothetical protein